MTIHEWTRRDFVKTTSAVAMGVTIGAPRRARASVIERQIAEGAVTVRDARVKALVLRTLDAARAAGAQYADVRMTVDFSNLNGSSNTLGWSVRALVGGSWGFASSPYVADDEGPRLARSAVGLAMSIRRGKPRAMEWHPVPVVSNGDWTTPHTIDPTTLDRTEMHDWVCSITGWGEARGLRMGEADVWVGSVRQDRLFASTEGSLITQTVYSAPQVKIAGSYQDEPFLVNSITSVTGGWDYFYERSGQIRDELLRIKAEIAADARLPVTTLDIGRYDVVLDQRAVAAMISLTLAPATQLDRVLGHEANEGGTSYLGPNPMTVLGTPVTSPLVTLTADRSTPHGVATVQWDDEGVAPEEFTVINDGVLMDYQTTREQAPWLSAWYAKHGKTPRSHGCAAAPSGTQMPMQHTPNLAMTPGPADVGCTELVAGTEKGIAIHGLAGRTDQQCLTGTVTPWKMYEIKRGKRVARGSWGDSNLAIQFRAPEFWKSLTAIGGTKSFAWTGGPWAGVPSLKGAPEQSMPYSIGTVPVAATQLAFINPKRKS